MSKLKLFIILISLIVSGCERNEGNEKNKSNFSESFWIEDYVSNLNFPWSFTWLPNGDLLITERLGKIKLIRNGKFINYIKNVPNVMSSSPFDGLLDITIDPDFLNNSLIYLSYTKGTTTNRIGVVYRAKLENNSLINGKEIYNTSIPKDNPIKIDNPDSKPGLWATGLRSVGGLALDDNNQLWAIDMGPQGGDELNIIEPGGNHGFPLVSWGFDYSGRALSEKQTAIGFIDPIISWSPSISPFGLAYYNSDIFPNWKGDFFIGVLGDQTIIRIKVKNKKVIHQENIIPDLNERIRSIEVGPDGFIYASTDSSNGKIIRLRPGKPEKDELERVSKPFPMPIKASITERLKLHGVMQNEETMLALREKYDPKKAEFLYNDKCSSCHSLKAKDGNILGPHLESIAGRRSGSLTNYKYSQAMELSNQTSLIWDSRSITAFLTNPNGIFPGTKMIAEPLNFKDAILISKFLTKKKDTE